MLLKERIKSVYEMMKPVSKVVDVNGKFSLKFRHSKSDSKENDEKKNLSSPDSDNKKESIIDAKKSLRSIMRKKIASYCCNLLKTQQDSSYATFLFIHSELYEKARTILVFLSNHDEMDTFPLIKQALSDGKRVAVPRIVPGTNLMDFFYLDKDISLESQLEKGSFGIREPKPFLKKLDASNLPLHSLMLVPGLAFGHDGTRLGKGKGFYDRFIMKLYSQKQAIHLPSALIGWCFSMQIVDNIPVTDDDVSLTHLLTENGLVSCF